MPWRGSDGSVGGGSYESWVERSIREAQERGEFDDLPLAGKPLPEGSSDPDWWVRSVIKREQLDITPALPPQFALRKEADNMPDRVKSLRTEQAVRDEVEVFNEKVRAFWRQPQDGPMVVVRTLDVEELVGIWRDYQAAKKQAKPSVSGQQAVDGEDAKRSFFKRLFGSRSR